MITFYVCAHFLMILKLFVCCGKDLYLSDDVIDITLSVKHAFVAASGCLNNNLCIWSL